MLPRRDLELEADLFRDLVYQIRLTYPKAEEIMDELVELGQPKTPLCLKHRKEKLEEMLKGFYLEKRKKANVQSKRQYLVQGFVDETQ